MPVLFIQASRWGSAGFRASLGLRAFDSPISLFFSTQHPRLWQAGDLESARNGAPNPPGHLPAQPGPRSSKRASRKSRGNM